MALTPVEIRHLNPGRALFGYKSGATDQLLDEIADSFEDVWRERADLADKVEQLEGDLVRFRELEGLLRATLVSAERASAETKDQARREAELILTEAHTHARELQRQAVAENERLRRESQVLRERLRAALADIDAPEAAAQPAPVAPPVAPEAPAPPVSPEAAPSPESRAEVSIEDTFVGPSWHGEPFADSAAA